MKKQLQIDLTFLLVAAFFITAEIIPEITNHLTDQKTTNTITVSHGSTQTTPTKVNLSYKERLSYFFIRNDRCLGNFDNSKGRNFDGI